MSDPKWYHYAIVTPIAIAGVCLSVAITGPILGFMAMAGAVTAVGFGLVAAVRWLCRFIVQLGQPVSPSSSSSLQRTDAAIPRPLDRRSDRKRSETV